MRTLKNKKAKRGFKVKKLLILSVKSKNQNGHVCFIGPANKTDFKAVRANFSKNRKTKIWSLPFKECFWTNGKIGFFLDDDKPIKDWPIEIVEQKKLSAIIKALVKT